MKLGKLIDGEIELHELEDGFEVGGTASEEEFYADGYKKVCLSEKENATDIEGWEEYPNCIVQTWTNSEIFEELTEDI